MKNVLKNTFGLDISNSALTAVELDYGGKGLRVVNFARVELPEGIVEDNCIIIERDAFKEALKKLLQEGYAGPFTSKNVIISIPEEKTFSNRMQIPLESAEDEGFIMESAKDFIPVELSDAVTDYKLMDKTADGKNVNIDFIAVQKNIVEAIIEILAEAGLKVAFVDVDKNSLMRACDNPMRKSDGDYMVINIGDEQSSFSINGQRGISYTIDSDIAGNGFVEKIKQDLQISTISEVKSLLNELRKDPESAKSEKYNNIMKALKEDCDKLVSRTLEIATVAETQDSLKIKNIYLIGSCSHIPGLIEALQSAFPEVKIITNFEYIQLNENTELQYAEAIGLALRAVFANPTEKEIDLLPVSKKQELLNKMLMPMVAKGLIGSCVVTSLLVVFMGFSAAKGYLDFKISASQVASSLEKANSPYLHNAAQASQQRTQMESQVDMILADAVPVHVLMKTVDSYNSDGIDLINASFQLSSQDSNDMRLRAKTSSRTGTEGLIAKLQNDAYFSKVTSPLSNLVGKGERFIDIDLIADMGKIISEYASSQKADETAVKQDSTDTKAKPKPAINPNAVQSAPATDVSAVKESAPAAPEVAPPAATPVTAAQEVTPSASVELPALDTTPLAVNGNNSAQDTGVSPVAPPVTNPVAPGSDANKTQN